MAALPDGSEALLPDWAKERLGGVSTVEALSVEASSVLSECAPSDENVQSPREEEEEAWVAVEGGGFEKAPRV